MYRFAVDYANKRIYIELSGHMDISELNAYTRDSLGIIKQFGNKEVSILAVLERLDPVSQESLPICIEGLSLAAEHIKKIAFVHKRFVTKMQFDKILNAVKDNCGSNLNSGIFNSKSEALSFLDSPEEQ